MLLAVVVALIALSHIRVSVEKGLAGILHLAAIAVSSHICVYIRLIMIQEKRSGMLVVGREVVPVPGGAPGLVTGPSEVVENGRPCNEHRSYEIVGAEDVRRAYYFHVIAGVIGLLGHQSGYVLENIVSEAGLDEEYVIVAFHGLKNSQIIYVTVPVEVQVRHRVGRGIEQPLEFLHTGRLCEQSRNCLKVYMQRNVVRAVAGLGHDGGGPGAHRSDGGAVISVLGSRRISHDSGRCAAREQHNRRSRKA